MPRAALDMQRGDRGEVWSRRAQLTSDVKLAGVSPSKTKGSPETKQLPDNETDSQTNRPPERPPDRPVQTRPAREETPRLTKADKRHVRCLPATERNADPKSRYLKEYTKLII